MEADRKAQSAIAAALRLIRARMILVLGISVALVLPCFWHKNLEAGDLASHVYNAWLGQLIQSGQAPGLALIPLHTNILVDIALEKLGGAIGFDLAGKFVAAACVLIFFWGAFALIAAASRRLPWCLLPAVAMAAYGWTFQMGFLNYYLSLGLAFFALALIWRARGIDWLLGLLLAGLALLAHPLGSVCLCAIAAYIKVAERLQQKYRWGLWMAVLAGLAAARFFIERDLRTQDWDTSFFYAMSGADQFVLFGSRYAIVAACGVLFGSVVLFWDVHKEKALGERWQFRTALEVWAILLFMAAMVPELIQLPWYASPVGFLVSRMTSVTAIFGLCVLGSVKPRWWHSAGWAAIAAVFFGALFVDTAKLNRMEMQAEALVRGLPYGQRVVARIEAPREWRVRFVEHMVDGACIGRCFAYANYEATSGQFRIRANAPNGVVLWSADDVRAVREGTYVVRRQDLPMTLIEQCDANDWTRLCAKELTEGERLASLNSR